MYSDALVVMNIHATCVGESLHQCRIQVPHTKCSANDYQRNIRFASSKEALLKRSRKSLTSRVEDRKTDS
jgi:hypothetical protein